MENGNEKYSELNLETMKAYLQGNLSADQQKQVEALIAEDPFTAEALEGLATLDNKAAIGLTIAGLNQQISAQSGAGYVGGGSAASTGTGGGNILSAGWVKYAAAAVTIGAVAGTAILVNKQFVGQDSAMAETEVVAPTESAEPTAQGLDGSLIIAGDSISSANGAMSEEILAETMEPVEEEILDGMAIFDFDEESLSEMSEKDAAGYGYIIGQVVDSRTNQPLAGVNVVTDKNYGSISDANGNFKILTEAGEQKVIFQNSGYKSSQTTVSVSKDAERNMNVALDAANGPYGMDNTLKESAPKTTTASGEAYDDVAETGLAKSKNVDLMGQAKTNYLNGNYKDAADMYDDVLSQQLNNREALYYGGISYLSSGKNNKAIKNFDQLLNNSPGSYYDGALWYKAQALVNKKKYTDAKTLLRELSAGSGPFKSQAEKQLNELD